MMTKLWQELFEQLSPERQEKVKHRIKELLAEQNKSPRVEHVCGLSGYNPMIDPPCPACAEHTRVWNITHWVVV